MALRTQKIIRESFLSLLSERPFDKISVRDIAERSEISRNTFYYYYQDIYALTEDILETEIERVASEVEDFDSWQKAFLNATRFASANRKAVFHIYNSANRNLIERYYRKTLQAAMLAYVRKEAEGLAVSERKVTVLARFYAAALVGLSADWLGDGMKGEPGAFLDDLSDMLKGNVRQALERAAACEAGGECAYQM